MEEIEKIFNETASKTMLQWNLEGFKKTHPHLFKAIIKSMMEVKKMNTSSDNGKLTITEERVEELSLNLANQDFDSNTGKVIIPLNICRQIVRVLTEMYLNGCII
jgi:hypothetical protein